MEIVYGVPEGWRKANLPEIAPIVTGKKDANFGTVNGKYLFFTCAQEPIKAPSYSFDCNAVILAGNGDFNVKPVVVFKTNEPETATFLIGRGYKLLETF